MSHFTFPVNYGRIFLLITSQWYFLIMVYVLGSCYYLSLLLIGQCLILEQALDEWKWLLPVLPFLLFLWFFVGEYHGAFVCESLWSLISQLCRYSGKEMELLGLSVDGTWDSWGVEVEYWGLGRVGPMGGTVGLKKQHGGFWRSNGLQKQIHHLHPVTLLINVSLIGKRKTVNVLHSSHLVSFNPQPVGEAEAIL